MQATSLPQRLPPHAGKATTASPPHARQPRSRLATSALSTPSLAMARSPAVRPQLFSSTLRPSFAPFPTRSTSYSLVLSLQRNATPARHLARSSSSSDRQRPLDRGTRARTASTRLHRAHHRPTRSLVLRFHGPMSCSLAHRRSPSPR